MNLWVVLGLLLLAPALAGAQVRRDSTARRDSITRAERARQDSITRGLRVGAKPDSAALDTAKKELVKWEQPDSAMSDLIARPGFTVTRYHGKRVIFNAGKRQIQLQGNAAVDREETVLVSDSITYNDSTRIVVALGDSIVLRDPSQGEDDVVGHRRMEYDLAARAGKADDVRTAVTSGERWLVRGHHTGFVTDTSAAGKNAFYALGGWLTSCTDSTPHYHFAARELKVVSKNVLVARPAVLYIGEVPVMWLPFIFQDLRSGRRSGLLPPRFGFSDIVRNSPTYRRTLEDFGYYFALSDFMDLEATVDWRSDARSTEVDPGYVRGNVLWNYRWLNRFLQGRAGYSTMRRADGQTNQAYSLNHQQEFSQHSSLSADLNYVTNTIVQRQATFNPYQSDATISSRINYTQLIGPLNVAVGGSMKQYPGRSEQDRQYPALSLTSKPVNIGEAFTWTPALSFDISEQLKMDRLGADAFRYVPGTSGGVDSVKLERSTRDTRFSFDTPIKLFGFNLRNSVRLTDQLTDAPQTIVVKDPVDSTKQASRVFARSFQTAVDWETSFDLPGLFQSSWHLQPSVNLANVSSDPYMVRTHLSGGAFVRQQKRLRYDLSVSPTFFGLFRGFGPVARFRHSLTPIVTYSYAPEGKLSTEYLRATNRTQQGFLGTLAQNRVSLNLSTNLEAKLRGADSASDDNARKIKILALQFSPLSWDFERAAKTGKSGFTDSRFDMSVHSDLLPGFDFNLGYSLFEGDPLADSAKFKPFRETIGIRTTLNRNSPIVSALGRLIGIRPDAGSRADTMPRQPTSDERARSVAGQPIAGSVNRAALYGVPSGQGWQMNLNFSASRQRPVTGDGANVVTFSPQTYCLPYVNDSFAYQRCLQQATQAPPDGNPLNNQTPGAPFYLSPASMTTQGSLSFNITQKWAAQWSTTYDFEAGDFSSHVVSLVRELHDWNATFAFTQAPNGNFAFNFFIALRAQPDLKFNYDRRSFRRPQGETP